MQFERSNGSLQARPEGRIDSQNAMDFQEQLLEGIDDADRAVIVDLEKVSYMSSAGLRSMLLVAKTLRRREVSFALCSMCPPIREVFKISGFDKVIRIHDSPAAAMQALGG